MTIWFAHCFVPSPGYGLVCPVLSSRARACRRDHQAPSAPLPDVGVAFVRETYPASCGDITPRSSLVRAHVPIPCGSPLLRFFTSFEESLQVATSPCCHRDLLDVILRVFPWLPGPLPRRSHRVHAPVNFPDVIGLPLGRLGRLPALVHDATSRGSDFEAADIPLCSSHQVCSIGIERGRASRRWRVTVLALSVCKAGSQFHRSHVSRGPPIIPDGRVSQVRFEVLAYRQ